jgi:hypothetical protein
VTPVPDEVLRADGLRVAAHGALGLALVRTAGGDVGSDELPVGQRLACAGLSLSALQRVVDGLVREGRVREVRGKDLWDLELPTAGTRATGRYYLAV